MNLYLSGPMSGYPDHNRAAFHVAAAGLAAHGFHVINPADLTGLDTWSDYMRAALVSLSTAEGVATLPGWQESRGSSLEVHIGQALGMPVLPVYLWATFEVPA